MPREKAEQSFHKSGQSDVRGQGHAALQQQNVKAHSERQVLDCLRQCPVLRYDLSCGTKALPSRSSSSGLTRGSKAKHPAWMVGYVYIVTNHKHGTLYIGVTSDLERRIYEHREELTPGFTSKYGCKQLVWYEEFWNIQDAIQREKSLKRWYRKWKIDLIEKTNPDWRDLYLELGC